MPGDDEGHIDEPVKPPGDRDGKVGVRFTVEQMMALLTTIIEKYESFAHLDRGSQNEQIVKYLSTRPEVEASEAGPGGTWVHFTDGGWLFLDNREWAGTDQDPATSSSLPPGPRPESDVQKMREKSEQITALIKSLQQGPSISPEDMKKKAEQIAALAKSLAQGIPGAPASVPSTPTPSVTPGDAARHYGVPGSKVVCLYSAFPEPAWFGNAEKYLKDFGYTVLEPKFNVTVDDLMALPPCAVFGLVSHGTMRFKLGVYDPPLVIYTTTLVTPFTMVQYWDLYENGQLAYYYQREEKGAYLGITEKFVRKFWQFDDNSFVFLDTCFAMNRATQLFRDTLFLKNASVVAGWTWKSLDNIGDETASYLFDRLLGANDFEGEYPVVVPKEEGRNPDNPKQRPFDWLALEPDMYAKGLGRATDTDYGVVTEIAFQAGKNGDFGLLRPSIKEVYVNDNEDERTLTIHGLFGRGELVKKKRVTVKDGTKKNSTVLYEVPPGNIEINDEGDEIVCKKFPKKDDGHAGYVTVTINDFESNCVPLTAWEAKFTFTVNKPGTPPGSDKDIICRITWETLIRGDVHDRRDRPGENAPYQIGKVFNDARDKERPAHLVHDSTYKGKDYRIIWKGSGNIVPSADPRGVVTAIGFTHPYDTRHPRIDLGMAAQVNCTVIGDDGTTIFKADDWPADASRLFIELPEGEILRSKVEWHDNFDIKGDSFSANIAYDPLDKSKIFPAMIRWEEMKAEYPPTKDIEG